MEVKKEKGRGKARLRGASKEEETPQGSVKLSGQLFTNFKASVLNDHSQTPLVNLRFHFRGAFVINSLKNFTLKLTFSPKFTGLTTLWKFPQPHVLPPCLFFLLGPSPTLLVTMLTCSGTLPLHSLCTPHSLDFL